jgi:hypothetical protein
MARIISQDRVLVDIKSDSVGPGVWREIALALVEGVDDFHQLGYVPSKYRNVLVDVETILFQYCLDLIPTLVQFGASDFYLRTSSQSLAATVIVVVRWLFEPDYVVCLVRGSEFNGSM